MFLKDGLVLASLAVLIVLVLAVLALVVRAATRPEPAGGARRAPLRLRSDTLRASFRQAVELIEAHIATRAQRYGLPWVLVLDEGHGEGGASAALPLAQSGVASALGTDATGSAATQGLAWHFFDKGVVIDVQGAYLGGPDDAENAAEKPWDEFLGLCREYRPERPFDALVVTLPAALLVDPGPDARLELARLAKRANRRIWLAQNRFAMRFALYVVVSGCERLPGFPAYARALPEPMRRSMLGWSSPHDLTTVYRSEWVADALAQTCAAVTDSSAELFATAAHDDDAAAYFLLPSRLDALRPQLQLYVDELMRPSSYHEPFILRGLYFSGDAGEAAERLARVDPDGAAAPPLLTDIVDLVDPALTAPAGEGAGADPADRAGPALPPEARQPVFLRDLFEQKIFVEYGLTRPSATQHLARPLLGRALRWSAWGLAGAWCVGLIAGSLILHRQSDALQHVLERLQRDADTQLRAAQRGESPSPEWQRERTLALLQLMAQMEDRRLWSVFMPGSWPVFDPLSHHLRERLQQAFGEVAVGTLRQGLYDRAARLTGVPRDAGTGELIAGAPCTDPAGLPEGSDARPATLGFEDLPDFARLLAYVAQVEQLDVATQALQRLLDPAQPASGADLGLLVRVVLGADLPSASTNAAALFRSRAAQEVPLRVGALQQATRCSLQRAGKALQDSAFDGNDLLDAQRQLDARLTELGTEDLFDGHDAALAAWRELLANIREHEALLARGGGAWLQKPALQPGPAWDRALARIAATSLLGPGAARALHDDADAAYRRFSSELAEQVNADTQMGLAWNDKTARWEITPGLAGLRDALAALFAQPWMAAGGEPRPLEAVGDPLVGWDLARLDQALAVADQRKRAQAELLARFPAEFRGPLERVVDEQFARQVGAHLAGALIPGLHPGAGAPDAAASEAQRGRLVRVQALLGELGARGTADALRGLLMRDAAARLRQLDEALDRAELYAPQGRSFGAWRGEKAPVLVAYGMPDGAALSAYLGQQRSRVEQLGREAELLLASAGGGGSPSLQAERWQAINRDLERYRLKNPNSSLLALENFLIAMAGDVDVTNCAERLGARNVAGRTADLFALRLQQLASAALERCNELREREQRGQWTQFATLFNRTAAGRSPFAPAPASPGMADRPAMEPDELAALLPAFERAQRSLRDLTGDPHRPGAAATRRFIDQFERVRGFLQPLVPTDENALAGYDLAVEFRANTAQEAEGNKVIDWAIDVGPQHLGWREPARPLRWEPGLPITLTLRLAKDGPAVPHADERQPALAVEGRTVTLRYADPWALLTLIQRQREAEPPAGKASDARSQLLRLEFPVTLLADAPGVTAGTDSRARVYLRLTLSAPGKRTPLAWPGAFPIRAPEGILP